MTVATLKPTDWRAEIEKAAVVVDRWWKDAHRGLGFLLVDEEDVKRRVTLAEQAMQKALDLLKTPESDKRNRQLATLVNAMYAYVDAPALSWEEPFRDTYRDTKEVAKEVADAVKPVAFGFGAVVALVVVGYIALQVRAWK